MAISLGQVGIADKGYYQPGVTYQSGNFVFYQGSTYLCMKDNLTNYTPENDGTNWKYLAQGAGGITDTSVDRIDDVGTTFPIPAAGESLALLFGKVKKFFMDQLEKNNDADSEIENLKTNKQNTLIAGANITIQDNVISAKGGGAAAEWKEILNIEAHTGNNTVENYSEYNEIMLVAKRGGYLTSTILPTAIFIGSEAKIVDGSSAGSWYNLIKSSSATNINISIVGSGTTHIYVYVR